MPFKLHSSNFLKQMEIFSGETRLDAPIGSRNPEDSLAKIGVDTLNVNGHLLANSAIKAKADLTNMVLDDCRYNAMKVLFPKFVTGLNHIFNPWPRM